MPDILKIDGNVLQVAAMAIAGLVGYGKLKSRQDDHQEAIANLRGLPVAIARVEQKLEDIDKRLDRLPCHRDGKCSS